MNIGKNIKIKDKVTLVYESPDGKWKINLRKISSSEDEIERGDIKWRQR
jgi:hypothetical protein